MASGNPVGSNRDADTWKHGKLVATRSLPGSQVDILGRPNGKSTKLVFEEMAELRVPLVLDLPAPTFLRDDVSFAGTH